MKVTLISQLPPPVHGSSVMTARLLATLEASGIEVAMVERAFSKSVGEVGSFSFKKVVAGFGLLRRFRKNIKEFRPDNIVFFITNRPFSMIVDWMLSEIIRARKLSTVAYVHTSGWKDIANRSSLLSWVSRRLVGACGTVVTLSPKMADDMRLLVSPNTREIVIPNAVDDVPDFRLQRRDCSQVLFLGNFIETKGILDFVELARRFENSRLMFRAAGAPISDVQLSTLQSSAPVNLQITTGVYGEEKATLLRSVDVLVVPSRYKYEAQPLVILEALSHGIPVVAYDTGGISDIVGVEHGGLLVEVGREDLLDEALGSLMNDRSFFESMRLRARSTYERLYSFDVYSNAWRNVL